MGISTDDLSLLPAPVPLRRLMQAMAALDAIISSEWENRFYSFDAHWAEGQMMGSMRDGSGDDLFVLFNSAGAFMKGFDHELEAPQEESRKLYAQVPIDFHGGVHEPAFSPENVTFCCWRRIEDTEWTADGVYLTEDGHDDGSYWMLAPFDGNPASYVAFANEYFEFQLDAGRVAAVYDHAPMTRELAAAINPQVDYAILLPDLDKIGYPTSSV